MSASIHVNVYDIYALSTFSFTYRVAYIYEICSLRHHNSAKYHYMSSYMQL